jgi:hypothetical protein
MASTVLYDGRLAIGGCMTSDEGDDIEQDEHYSSGMESGSSFEDEPDKPALPVRLVHLEDSGTGFNGTAGNVGGGGSAASNGDDQRRLEDSGTGFNGTAGNVGGGGSAASVFFRAFDVGADSLFDDSSDSAGNEDSGTGFNGTAGNVGGSGSAASNSDGTAGNVGGGGSAASNGDDTNGDDTNGDDQHGLHDSQFAWITTAVSTHANILQLSSFPDQHHDETMQAGVAEVKRRAMVHNCHSVCWRAYDANCGHVCATALVAHCKCGKPQKLRWGRWLLCFTTQEATMKLRVRSTAGAVVEVSVPASATVETFQQAAAQALGVGIRHVLYQGQVMRPVEKRLRVHGVRNRHELVVIVGQHRNSDVIPFDVGADSLFDSTSDSESESNSESAHLTSAALGASDVSGVDLMGVYTELMDMSPVQRRKVDRQFIRRGISKYDPATAAERLSCVTALSAAPSAAPSAALTLTAASNGDEVKIEQLASAAVPSPDPRSGGGDLLFKEGDKVMLAPTASAKSSQEGPLKMDVQGTIVAVDRQHADDDEPYQVLAGGDTYWYRATDLVRARTRPPPVDDTRERPVRQAKSSRPRTGVGSSDRRHRCMYGAGCYQKGIQHRNQFSHPSDLDWEEAIPCKVTIDMSDGARVQTRANRRQRGLPLPSSALGSPCMHTKVTSFKRHHGTKDPLSYEADRFKEDPNLVSESSVVLCALAC